MVLLTQTVICIRVLKRFEVETGETGYLLVLS